MQLRVNGWRSASWLLQILLLPTGHRTVQGCPRIQWGSKVRKGCRSVENRTRVGLWCLRRRLVQDGERQRTWAKDRMSAFAVDYREPRQSGTEGLYLESCPQRRRVPSKDQKILPRLTRRRTPAGRCMSDGVSAQAPDGVVSLGCRARQTQRAPKRRREGKLQARVEESIVF